MSSKGNMEIMDLLFYMFAFFIIGLTCAFVISVAPMGHSDDNGTVLAAYATPDNGRVNYRIDYANGTGTNKTITVDQNHFSLSVGNESKLIIRTTNYLTYSKTDIIWTATPEQYEQFRTMAIWMPTDR